MTVLTSHVSKMWPTSDAGLGAFANLRNAHGLDGRQDPLAYDPWMVTFFFILVVPHIVLVILQRSQSATGARSAWRRRCFEMG